MLGRGVRMHRELSAWQRWVHQPQNLWFRRAFFQIHLWLGIGVGLYVLAISLSGSAVVFARELTTRYARKPVILNVSGPPLSAEQLTQAAERAYPGYKVADIAFARRPERPAMVALTKAGQAENGKRIERLMDQYTGADLGDPLTPAVHVIQWVVNFHDNLLGGETGTLLNGIGAILVTLLSLAGAVLWWPGKKDWRRSLRIRWKSGLPRLNWDLHSAMGFWCFLFILLWGISGIYFSFPGPFNATADFLFPAAPHSRKIGFGDQALSGCPSCTSAASGGRSRRFGSFWDWFPRLMVTGALMWWNRSLRKIVASGCRSAERAPDLPPHPQISTPVAPALRARLSGSRR